MEERSPFGKQTNPLIFEICVGVGIVMMLGILFWFFVSGVYKQYELAVEQEEAEKAMKVIEMKMKEEEARARYQMKVEMERNAIRAAQSEAAWNAYRQAQADNRAAQASNNYIQFQRENGETESARGVIVQQRNMIIPRAMEQAPRSEEEKREAWRLKQEAKRAEECTSWKNSNIIEPTPEKRRKIAELCQEQ